MSPVNNETARVALVAEREQAVVLSAALAAISGVEIAAQAGTPRGGALPDIEWHDDPRGVLTQRVDAVLVSGRVGRKVDLLKAFCERGVAIWTPAPLCGSLSEAVELVRAAEASGGLLHIASRWRHAQPYLADLLETHEAFTPWLSEIRVALGPLGAEVARAGSDPAAVALLFEAYAALEALVALRGLPESVQAVLASSRREADAARDDAAAALLHYSQRGLAIVQATRGMPPFEEQSKHHGCDNALELGDSHLALLDRAGAPLVREALPADWLTADLRMFVEALRATPRTGSPAVLERHLAVTALIEAMQLSARTRQMEHPAKFYEVLGLPEPKP